MLLPRQEIRKSSGISGAQTQDIAVFPRDLSTPTTNHNDHSTAFFASALQLDAAGYGHGRWISLGPAKWEAAGQAKGGSAVICGSTRREKQQWGPCSENPWESRQQPCAIKTQDDIKVRVTG